MVRHILLAITDCTPGEERKFHDWYDTQHLPDVLAIPGFVRAERFAGVPNTSGEEPAHRFLAIYEIDTEDIAATMADLRTAAKGMEFTDVFDRSATAAFCYASLGPAQEAG